MTRVNHNGDTNEKDIEKIIDLSELTDDNKDYYVYEYYIEETEEVFYVGKGIGNRAWRDVRNLECEKIKSKYNWDIRIVQENLKENEALKIERKLIDKYRKESDKLTNIMPGNSPPTEKEKIGCVKYLVFLVEKNVLNLTLSDISSILLINPTTVWSIANTDDYNDVEPMLPENIGEIIQNHHVHAYTENQVKIGNIKYVLDLIHKNVLNLTQAELSNYYGETPSNISSIKKGNTHKNVPLLIPEDIGDIFKKYDVFYVSEEEKKRGMLVFIIRLREEGIIKITNKDIGRILDVSPYFVAEFTRRNEDRKYTAKEYRPNAEVMAKLSSYFIIK